MNQTPRQIIGANGYKLGTRAEFEAEKNLPEGLRERAATVPGGFIVYDLFDNAEGWLLIGDDADALVAETVEERCRE